MADTPDPLARQASKPARWRFSLRGLLLLTLSVAVCLGLGARWGVVGFLWAVVLVVPLWLLRSGPKASIRAMRVLVLYGAASIFTLPMLDWFWIGELPVLALVQLPKTMLASAARYFAVTQLMGPLGVSQGSFSPDWSLARPYALAFAYIVPLVWLLTAVGIRTRFRPPCRAWACVLLVVATIDFALTLALAGGPGLSIY